MGATVRTEYTTGRGQNYPIASTLAAPPAAAVFGVSPQQVSASATATVSLTFPVAPVGAIVSASAKVALLPWPQKLTLKARESALVSVCLSIGALTPQLLVGLPYTVLTFGAGSPLYAPGTGISTYTLQPGRTYASPAVSFTLQALVTQAYTNPLVVPITVGALLFGATS